MKTFILCKESKFILEIIKQLSMTPSKELTLKELEERIGIAKQTIKNYSDTLLIYCKQNQLNTFTLKNNVLKMSTETNFNILEFYAYLAHKSTKYQILTRIFEDPQLSFTKLYLDLTISKTTLSLHIRQLNDFLKSYHCQINFLHRMPIHGEEHQIRFLYYNLFWGTYLENIVTAFPNLNIFSELLLEIIPCMTDATLSRIKLTFYISQVRNRNGQFITLDDNFKLPDSPYITYDDFYDKINTLNLLMHCPDLETKHRECRYLYFSICRISLLTLEECQHIDFQITNYDSPEIQYLITQFLSKSSIILQDYELKYLHYNLSLLNQEATLIKGEGKVFDLNTIINRFDTYKEHTINFIKQFLVEIFEENQAIKKLVQQFPNLYHHYTLVLAAIVENHHQPLKLLVQSSISTLHQEALVSFITKATPFPIKIYTSSQQLHSEKPDGIISNWLPDKKYQDIPFFSTSLFYTDWNHEELACFIITLADHNNTV